MNQIELEKHYIVRDGHTFTPRTNYVEIELEDGTIDFDYTITATAEEVYQEWLIQKDLPPQPNETEVLRQELDQTNLYVTELELQNLQQQNEINTTNQFATELELQILELQMGGAV